MPTLTINIDNQLKQKAQKKTDKDGVTLTFVVNQCLKAYASGDIKFTLSMEKPSNLIDEEIVDLTKQLEKQLAKKVNFDKLPSVKKQLERIKNV